MPVTSSELPNNHIDTANSSKGTEKTIESSSSSTTVGGNALDANLSLPPADLPVRSTPDMTATIVPVLSVCAIFLSVTVIALLFKKKIYLARKKKTKKDDIVSKYFIKVFGN